MQSAIFLCSVVGNGPSTPKYPRCSMYLLHLINSVKFDFHTANIWKSFGISKYFLFGYSNSFVFSFIYKNRAKLKNIPPLFLTNVVKRFELTKFYCFSQQVYSSLIISIIMNFICFFNKIFSTNLFHITPIGSN